MNVLQTIMQVSHKVCPSSVITLIDVSFLFLVELVGSSDRARILTPDGRLLFDPDGVESENVLGHG